MRIYRYENEENGLGPLHNGICRSTLPAPREDNIPNFEPGNMLCGCTSKDQLATWFDDDAVDYMLMKGFSLREYDVPDDLCFVGEHQVAFYFY